jgi:RHS repeat-associated protein
MIAEYAYDPLGRRYKKVTPGETLYFYYSDEGLVGEFDSTGAPIRVYGYVPDSIWTTNPIYVKNASGYGYYRNDHLGTPQQVVAKNGAKTWEGVYRAFGEIKSETGSWEQRLRFAGQYYDEESGNYYNYFRDYDPSTGRYLQSDPIELLGGLNTFTFVRDNPVSKIDPKGLFDLPPIFGGVEGNALGGFGYTIVTCCTDDGRRRRMTFWKSCAGASVNIGLSAGIIGGLSGERCSKEYYTGWFLEINAGPVGIDIGLDEDFYPTDTNEAGIGAGLGGGVAMCYYKFIDEDIIGECDCEY